MTVNNVKIHDLSIKLSCRSGTALLTRGDKEVRIPLDLFLKLSVNNVKIHDMDASIRSAIATLATSEYERVRILSYAFLKILVNNVCYDLGRSVVIPAQYRMDALLTTNEREVICSGVFDFASLLTLGEGSLSILPSLSFSKRLIV